VSITANWSDLEPGTMTDQESHETTLASHDDVRNLLNTLARPNTSEAYLVHEGRPTRYNPALAATEIDHGVVIAVRHGFGYMEYADPDRFSQLVGNPAAPGWHTTESGYFRPGTGVPVETLIEAVTEFLLTAQRPTCVRWREVGHE
jgi:hypothetical protein